MLPIDTGSKDFAYFGTKLKLLFLFQSKQIPTIHIDSWNHEQHLSCLRNNKYSLT